jgi:hypothetical protein
MPDGVGVVSVLGSLFTTALSGSPEAQLHRREFKLTLHQRKESLARRERGEESQTDIAHSYNVSHSTISSTFYAEPGFVLH